MPRQGNKRKKRRTHVVKTEEQYDEVPKSLVLRRTDLVRDCLKLEHDIREMLYPFTSMNLKESKKLKIHEIIKASKNFNAKNLLFMTSKGSKNYIKFLR